MTRRILFFFVLTLLCLTPYSNAQNWSGIIDRSRAIDWSNAGAAGGIPNRTTICATINPGATAAQINSAIAACPAGQVVFLNAGIYNLSSGITFSGKSNVTVRGAGSDKSFLVFSGSTGCQVGGTDICIGNSINPTNPDHTANWTAGYSKGTTTISLSNTTGLAVGDILVLDQLDDSNTDTRNIWICSTINVCSSEGDSNIRRVGRSQSQVVVVTAISGSTVTFTPGLYMPNWRSSQSPGAWWNTVPTVSGIGVEDLSLDFTNSGGLSGISVSAARDWWIKNIRSVDANRAALWTYGATRGTIRDSYFFGTQNSQSQSYGIETDLSSDLLVENNIFQALAAPAPAGESVTGSVYGYNFAVNDFYVTGGDTAWMQASSYHHSSGISFHLYEGNIGPGFTADQIHGTSNFMTGFRNRWIGWDTGKAQQTNAVHIYSYNRYFNVIGNVLGLSAYHTNYTCNNTSTTDSCAQPADLSVYVLGFSGNEGSNYSGLPNDSLVASTLMRWGNYDTVNAANRFSSSEVPSGLNLYGNALPTSQALPSSFYLSSKPTWWGTMPWPPIGPDVTGGNISGAGGHAYFTPAANCYSNVMHGLAAGSGSVLNFNASNCYGSGGGTTQAPAAPTGLTAIVQ